MPEDKDQASRETSHFEWRDYFAIVIAMFETTLLPLVIAVVLLILLSLVLRR
jgi:hypothetical protein